MVVFVPRKRVACVVGVNEVGCEDCNVSLSLCSVVLTCYGCMQIQSYVDAYARSARMEGREEVGT